jgi:hypothetical protein
VLSEVSFWGSLAVVLLGAVVSIPPGIALTRGMPRRGGRGTPEHLALAALVGTGLSLLLFGLLSNLGLRGAAAGPSTVALLGLVTAVAARRGAGEAWDELRRPVRCGPLAAIALAGAIVSLMPLLVYRAFNPYNDTYTYLGAAEYIHLHPFPQPADPNPYMPLYGVARLHQKAHLRMGATYFLAFVRAILPVERAIAVFPGVAAWALALNVFAVFLLCRWAARLPSAWALGAAAVAAIWPSSLHFAAAQGFLPQLFGTAFLALALALLGRGLARREASWGSPLLFALAGATLTSVYSELLPFLVLTAAVVVAGRLAGPSGRRASAARFALVALAGFLLFANHEVLRMVQALPGQMRARVGTSMVMSPVERFGNLYGLFAAPQWDRDFWRYVGPSRDWVFPILAVAVAALVALGTAVLLRRFRARLTWVAASLLFVAVAAYYGWCVRDPWSGLRGHSWNLFKLAQWSYPLALVPLAASLGIVRSWSRRRRPRRAALAVALAACLPLALAVHAVEADHRTGPIRAETGSDRPFDELSALSKAVGRLVPGPVVCVRAEGMSVRLRQMLVYYLHPRGVSSDWRNDAWIYVYLSRRNWLPTAPCRGGVVTTAGEATNALAALPAGLALDRGEGPGQR